MGTRRTLAAAVCTLTAVAALGCGSLRVRSFAASPATPSPQYRTYRWADDGPRQTGDPRLDNNPFFERRLIGAADRNMAARGFEKVASGSADLVLHYHASVNQRIDVLVVDRTLGPCLQCPPATVYDAGTIMLDLVDAKNNVLVWRGWAEGSFDGMIDNQEWLERRVDEAVDRIAATIPRTF